MTILSSPPAIVPQICRWEVGIRIRFHCGSKSFTYIYFPKILWNTRKISRDPHAYACMCEKVTTITRAWEGRAQCEDDLPNNTRALSEIVLLQAFPQVTLLTPSGDGKNP